MSRDCIIDSIVQRRRREIVEDIREWDRRQVRQYTGFFIERQLEAVERGELTPERRPGSHLAPGLHERHVFGSFDLFELRIRCWAKIKARRHVRWMRETEGYR